MATTHSSRQAVSPAAPEAEKTSTRSSWAARSLAVLRIGFGLTFLWAFADKVFGWGYATKSGQGWIDGGDPTKGFLTKGTDGPFKELYAGLAGDWWVSPLFMIGLAGIGIALTLGVGMRIAAVCGVLLYVLMWSAALPPANNPVLDDHILGAITLVVLAATLAGDTWGLGRQWARTSLVRRYEFLR